MWASLTVWATGLASTLVGGAIMRLATRAFLFFGIVYGSEFILGDNPASAFISNVVNPNDSMQELGDTAFGQAGVASWGNFFLYLTDIWTPVSWFVSAAASWFIVKNVARFIK